MNIQQKKEFGKITIEIETDDEAISFWFMTYWTKDNPVDIRARALADELCEWFSNNKPTPQCPALGLIHRDGLSKTPI